MAISLRRLCTRQCPQTVRCSERSLALSHSLGGDSSSSNSRPTPKSESRCYLKRFPSKFESLPTELISAIADQLPLVSRHALHLTCRKFYIGIPTDYSKLDVCAKYGVLCFMIQDGLIKEVKKYACVLCKTLHSKARFYPSFKSDIAEVGRGMVRRKPSERFCMLHYHSLVTFWQSTEHNRWTTVDIDMCTHCGHCKLEWSCTETCETCGVSRVHTYQRSFPREIYTTTYTMSRDEDGTLFIREGT